MSSVTCSEPGCNCDYFREVLLLARPDMSPGGITFPTSMINGLSNHKLFAASYEKLRRENDSSDDGEHKKPKRAS